MQKALSLYKYPILFVALVFLFAAINQNDWQKILAWHMPDSDDVTRVLEVRAWLAGQSFYDMVLHSSNLPDGVNMHWSRLSDIPLAATQLLLRPFFTPDLAEKIAVFFTPLWLGAIFAILTGMVARKLSGAKYAFWIAIFITILADSVTFAFIPGRVDHHGIQLITLMMFLYGLLRPDLKGGIIAGIALGASLTIGFELLPLQLILTAWLAIVWACNSRQRQNQILGFCFALLAAIIIGFIIDNPPQDYLIGANDELSIAQLVPICIGGILFGLSAKFITYTALWVRFCALFIIALCVGLAALQFPILFAKLYWQVSPLLRELWLDEIGEMFPMRNFPIQMQIEGALFSLLAMLAAVTFSLRFFARANIKSNQITFENWALFSVALLIMVLMTYFYQMRVFTHATALAIIISASIIGKLMDKNGVLYALIGFIILSPTTPDLISKLLPQSTNPKTQNYNYGGEMKCHSKPDFAQLLDVPKGLVLSNINMGSEIMLLTGHNAISTSFHRDMGKDIAYKIWISPPDVAKQKIKARGINYVAFCNKSTEIPSISNYAPNGLMAQLANGHVPDYLEKIAPKSETDVVAFKVK